MLEVDKRDMEHIFAAWHDLGSNIVKRYLQKLSVGLLQRLRYQRSAAANQQHGNGVFCGRRERLNSDDATHGSGIDMDMWLLWWSDLCAGAGRAACALCRSVAAAQTPRICVDPPTYARPVSEPGGQLLPKPSGVRPSSQRRMGLSREKALADRAQDSRGGARGTTAWLGLG